MFIKIGITYGRSHFKKFFSGIDELEQLTGVQFEVVMVINDYFTKRLSHIYLRKIDFKFCIPFTTSCKCYGIFVQKITNL